VVDHVRRVVRGPLVGHEPISSATAEATVNQVIAKPMVKKQQVRRTPAEHATTAWPPPRCSSLRIAT